MAVPSALLHALARLELRQYPDQQGGRIKQQQAWLEPLRQQELGELIPNALHGDDGRLQAGGPTANRGLNRRLNRKLQDGGEANRAQHAQGILVEGDLGIERRYYPARLEVLQA